jgi:hypothetical protein
MSQKQSRGAEAITQDGADRRASKRFSAEEVPWITLVKANLGETARLVDISRTGILIDTHARLQPGRKNILLLGTESEQKRIESLVVRTQLIGLVPKAGPLYRAALTFTKDLELTLPDVAAPTAEAARPEAAPVAPSSSEAAVDGAGRQLSGPFDALWATESGAGVVTVSSITETGCLVEGPALAAPGESASLSVFFSVARRSLLTGKVTHMVGDHACAFQFGKLSAEERRALRVEIRRGTMPPTRVQAYTLDDVCVEVPIAMTAHASTRIAILQTNHW